MQAPRAALEDHGKGEVFVCPGRDTSLGDRPGQAHLSVPKGRQCDLFGAGSGNDPAIATILDGLDNGRVFEVAEAVSIAMSSFRRRAGCLAAIALASTAARAAP